MLRPAVVDFPFVMLELWRIIRLPYQNWQTSALRDVVLSVGFLICICVYVNIFVFLHPFSWILQRRRRNAMPRRRDRQQHRWNPNLDDDDDDFRNRRRSLSYYNQQEQSIFLSKLPIELRQEIYSYVLCGRVKHFTKIAYHDSEDPRDFQLNGIEYRAYETAYPPVLKRLHSSSSVKSNKSSNIMDNDHTSILSLILTCHQVYTEAVDIVYKSPVFKVSRLFTLHDLFVTLPPARFAAIRNLKLDYEFRCGMPMVRATFVREDADWERFWTIAATRMPSLRSLEVDLWNLDIPSILSPDMEVRAKWLLPIVKVKGLEMCEFCLHPARKANAMLPSNLPPISEGKKGLLKRLGEEIARALMSRKDSVKSALLTGESWYNVDDAM